MGVTGIALGIGIGPFDNGGGGGGFAPQGASLTLTGGDATLLAPLIVDGASLSLSGGAVNFARDLGAAGNSLTLSGGAATLSGGSALSVITSSNGAWWVVAERDGSGNLVDQTGGGRDLLLPGGSANPVLLDHTGTNYFWLPGTNGNGLTVPDSAALSITGDIDLQVYLGGSAFDAGVDRYLLSKWDTSSNQKSFAFYIDEFNNLEFLYSTNGSTTSSVAAIYDIDNESFTGDQWLRITVDVDNGSGGADIKVFKGGDGDTPSWTQMGSTRTLGSTISFFDGSATVQVGGVQNAVTQTLLGRIYRAIIKDGIDGTTVLDVNASDADPDATTFTEASSNATTVTINRSSTGYKTAVVDQPLYVFATDDYLSATADAMWNVGATDDFSVLAVWRSHGNNTTQHNIVSNGDAATYWFLAEASTDKVFAQLDDGPNQLSGVTPTAQNGTHLFRGAFARDQSGNVVTYDLTVPESDTDANTTGALASGSAFEVGRYLTTYGDFELIGLLYCKGTAFTQSELSDLADALITANGGTP